MKTREQILQLTPEQLSNYITSVWGAGSSIEGTLSNLPHNIRGEWTYWAESENKSPRDVGQRKFWRKAEIESAQAEQARINAREQATQQGQQTTIVDAVRYEKQAQERKNKQTTIGLMAGAVLVTVLVMKKKNKKKRK